MATKKTSIAQFVKKQVTKWEQMYSQAYRQTEASIPVITLSMEPGSGGSMVARRITDRLEFDLFNREIIEEISKSAEIRETVIETLEKDRLSGVEDFIASLVKDQYIHPDLYLEHLFKVVSTIGKHGQAVIVGRGANFILPPDERFSVRIVAPFKVRIQNVVTAYGVSQEDAKRRIIYRESRRKAYIRQSFNADIADPINYELTINTGKMSLESSVEAVIGSVMATLPNPS